MRSKVSVLGRCGGKVTRGVAFYPSAIERGERSERALKVAVAEMYVQGVSTRKVVEIIRPMSNGVDLSYRGAAAHFGNRSIAIATSRVRPVRPSGTDLRPGPFDCPPPNRNRFMHCGYKHEAPASGSVDISEDPLAGASCL